MDAPLSQPESPYDASRRLENLARLGTVAQVRLQAPARVRVRSGGNLSDWVPWVTQRAGGAAGGRKWHPPVVGEQVLLICPGGDPARGVALLGVYSDAREQGSTEAGCERTDWDQDNYWQWLAGALDIRLTERCTISINDQVALELRPDSASISTPQAAISIGPGGTVTISAASMVTITAGGATLTIGHGQVSSTVDVVASTISLITHVHDGVEPGEDTTGLPQ